MTSADDKIKECIEDRRSFLLDAGAGSGKTNSLVKALNHIRLKLRPEFVRSSQKVACITFTNVAKDEIIERTENDPLFTVSTIHDFLWSVIRAYQRELRTALLIANENLSSRSRRKQNSDDLVTALENCEKVVYSDRGANYMEGRIFHDDLLNIAEIMFKRHIMLCRIVSARYPFIFVDEYQDTSPKVIDILIDHILETRPTSVIGLFGDKFQSIYSNVIGELPKEQIDKLQLIQKEENYRCSIAVVKLLNRVRTDIKQIPAKDNAAGAAIYINLYEKCDDDDIVSEAARIARNKFNWQDQNGETKILYLTHRLIARRAGYEELWNAYNNHGAYYKDQFQSGEDEIARFFFEKVEALIEAWKLRKVGKAVSLISTKQGTLASLDVKCQISAALDQLVELSESNATIKDIVKHLSAYKMLPLLDELEEWLDKDEPDSDEIDEESIKDRTFFQDLFTVPYEQIRVYRDVLYNNLPYSTKHGVKGDEFDTVFVILDDAGANWNQYSFQKFLTCNDTSENRYRRTRNLFYVCCSRSKNKLAIVDLSTPSGIKEAVHGLFGQENCVI